MDEYEKYNVNNFSSHLFWDVRKEEIELGKNKSFIIQRVMEYGLYEDWLLINKIFGFDKILEVSKKLRSLDPKALHFLAHLSNTPLNEFRCYNYQQSIPKHWDF